jgi:integrase
VALRGLHSVRRRLADGTERVYVYAWRGGPRIAAAPGTPEFAAEFARLTAGRDKAPDHHAGTLTGLMLEYQRSPAFRDLAADTRAGYARRIARIEAEWGDTPVALLADDRMRGDFLDWRDRLAAKGRREADYCLTVLARVLSWAHDRRRIPTNILARPGRLYDGSRVDAVWTEAQVEALLTAAPPQVGFVVQVALWTGQRLGDVLRLTWAAWDGQALRLRQAKGGRHMVIPAAAALRDLLEAARRARGAAVTICTTSRGRPWTRDGYQSSFARACELAGISGRTFHDLRGTAATRLALAGCTVPEIASITGHSLRDVETILDRHYLSRDRALAESAVRKLEAWHGAGTGSVKRGCKTSPDQPEEPPATG